MKEFLTTISCDDARELLHLQKRVAVMRRVSEIVSLQDSFTSSSISDDIDKAEKNLSESWLRIAGKYDLKATPGGRWIIDFQTNAIHLIS